MVCRFSSLLLLVLAAGPAQAQVATAMNFRTSEVTSSGAEVRSSQGFTLYALGYWQRPASLRPEEGARSARRRSLLVKLGPGRRSLSVAAFTSVCAWSGAGRR